MRRLERFFHYRDYVTCQSIYIRFVTHSLAKRVQRLLRIVLASEEAPVDDRLNAAAQRLKECRNRERGGNDDELIVPANERR